MPHRRNRAILADIANLGLDPKKNYTRVNKTGNLIADLNLAKTQVNIELKQSQKVEEPKLEQKVELKQSQKVEEPKLEQKVDISISEVPSEESIVEYENILSTEIVEELKVEDAQVKTSQPYSGKKKKK